MVHEGGTTGTSGASSEGASNVYTKEGLDRELRQGEIITSVVQWSYDFQEGAASGTEIPISIVLSQDCDLLQEFDRVERGATAALNGVLMFEARAYAEVRGTLGGSDIAKRVRNNADDRWHYLEAIPSVADLSATGLDPLVIDFKRFYSIAPRDLYKQIELLDGPKRRCRLEMPYREHLQSRLAFYLARVALPTPHR